MGQGQSGRENRTVRFGMLADVTPMLRAEHERRYTLDRTPERRFRHEGVGDIFVVAGCEMVKLAPCDGCSPDPDDIRLGSFTEDQWLCEC
jgi:hypothetical protein